MEVLHAFTGSIQDFLSKVYFSYPSSMFKQFFSLFFCNMFYLCLACFLITELSFRHFSTSCNILNSLDEMSPSCIVCEMISVMLSNLFWTSSEIASCFSCITVSILKSFRIIALGGEKSWQASINAIPEDYPAPLEDTAIEAPPVINVGLIRPASSRLVIVLTVSNLVPRTSFRYKRKVKKRRMELNCFIFFAYLSQTSISSSKYASVSERFWSDMFVVFVVLQG